MQMLMRVDVRQPQARPLEPFQLGAELAADVVGIDRPAGGADEELAPRQVEAPVAIDKRWYLGGRQQWRVLADDREMGPDADAVGVAERRRPRVEGRRDGERGGAGDDPVAVGREDGPAHAAGETEIVSVDDEEPVGHSSGSQCRTDAGRGRSRRISGTRRRISRTMSRITAPDDSVDTPRVRAK